MNELKRELSKLTGIDMFSPKFREVFKKYFPDEKDAEEEKLDDVIPNKTEDSEVKEVENKVEDIDKAEDEREIDKIEEDKADDDDKKDEKKEEVKEESEEIGKDVDEVEEKTDKPIKEIADDVRDDETDKLKDELTDTKIELELVKSGVRADKLESAKKYTKYAIDGDLSKIGEVLKEYPEWRNIDKPRAIGMSVDETGDGLTEEEKRLKAMGINPRD